MPLSRLRSVLLALAAAFTAAGLVALVWQPSVSSVQVAGASIANVPAGISAFASPDPSEIDVILRSNIFSPTRAAPRSRYSPDGPETDTPDTAMNGMATGAGADSVATSGVPAFFGTMIGPDGAQALLHLDASETEPKLYRVDDRAGGYRVVRIEEREVTLSGPRGRVVLRLPVRDEESR